MPATTPFDVTSLIDATLVVTKGCKALPLSKGMRVRVASAVYSPDRGYRLDLHFIGGRRSLCAASSARLKGEELSLNDGNPLHNVRLKRLADARAVAGYEVQIAGVTYPLGTPAYAAIARDALRRARRIDAPILARLVDGTTRQANQTLSTLD